MLALPLTGLLWVGVTFSQVVTSADLAGDSWQSRQRSHRPASLDERTVLEQVALLDTSSDPEGHVFDGHLNAILGPRFVTTAAHDRVRQYIVSTMESLGWHVDGNSTVYMRTPLGRMPFTNVVATHDYHAPRRLVLACHYDSIYRRDKFDAATDSAVPCAMMLHLASLITKRYLDPVKGRAELTLQLMFFDGEEAIIRWTDQDSIYGSRQLARQLHNNVYLDVNDRGNAPVTQLDRIDLLVLLDLLGARSPQIWNYFSDTNGQFKHLAHVERKLRSRGLLHNGAPDVIFNYKKSWGIWGPPQISDDHLPFQRRGVKILHLIPHPFPEVWHTDRDNADIIHYPTVTNLNRILRVFVLEYLGTFGYL